MKWTTWIFIQRKIYKNPSLFTRNFFLYIFHQLLLTTPKPFLIWKVRRYMAIQLYVYVRYTLHTIPLAWIIISSILIFFITCHWINTICIAKAAFKLEMKEFQLSISILIGFRDYKPPRHLLIFFSFFLLGVPRKCHLDFTWHSRNSNFSSLHSWD